MGDQQVSFPVVVAAILYFAGTIAAGIFSRRNKRDEQQAAERPSIEAVWARLGQLEHEVDEERDARRSAQQAARMARDETRMVKTVFRAFADRVSSKYPDVKLSDSERALLDSEPEYPDVDVTVDPRHMRD